MFLEFSDLWLWVKEALVLAEIMGSSLKTKSNFMMPGPWANSLGPWAPAPSCPMDKHPPPKGGCPLGTLTGQPCMMQMILASLSSHRRLCVFLAPASNMCTLFTPGTSALKNSESIISCSDFQRTDVIGKNPFRSPGLK